MVYFDDELASTLIDILDEIGPFQINTNIASHNIFLEKEDPERYMELLEKDNMTIGESGKKVTKSDLKNFLFKAKKYGEKDAFNNGRSYFFEGITKVGEKSYEFDWGS